VCTRMRVMHIICFRFLGSVTRTLGSVAAMTIRNIEVERLPALLVIMRMRSATEIFTVVHGMINVCYFWV
jgi:hypothetical protein